MGTLPDDVYQHFPKLRNAEHEKTSERTYGKPIQYNCLAWAAGDNLNWWETRAEWYWPTDYPPDLEFEPDIPINIVMDALRAVGFQRCDDSEYVPGHDTVALYASDGIFKHAARRISDQAWTSKLGDFEDIEHATLECLSEYGYGKPTMFMRRTSCNDKTKPT